MASSEPARSGEVSRLIQGLDSAVRLRDTDQITGRIKQTLQDLVLQSEFRLPEEFQRDAPDDYARRLLHRDPDLGYTVVVMTWGPGQTTELHDHAGIWCVECVVEGRLDVSQFDLVDRVDDRCRFKPTTRTTAQVGDAGCLIPPFEYHVLSNALPDRNSITLHVYGGEMESCNVYLPSQDEGWWQCRRRQLAYNH